MSNINLIDSFKDFKDEKKIDRPYMESVLQEVVKSMLRRKYGTEENCDIILNVDKGDIEIWRTRKVMEDGFSEDDALEIELAEAKKLDDSQAVGDDYLDEIRREDFGRRAIRPALTKQIPKIMKNKK